MSASEKTKWKQWADELRQELMQDRTGQVTKTIEVITAETATTKVNRTMKSTRFWNACQQGSSPNEILVKAGFELEFEPNDNCQVEEVTFRLNESWTRILQTAIDRESGSQQK